MEFHVESYGIEAIPWLCNSPDVNPTANP